MIYSAELLLWAFLGLMVGLFIVVVILLAIANMGMEDDEDGDEPAAG